MTRLMGICAVGVMMVVLAGCATWRTTEYEIAPEYTVRDPQFLWTVANLFGASLKGGNSVRTFSNGDAIFPAMLEAIRGARKTVTLETYIFDNGRLAKTFAEALTARARAGVKVSVLMDAVGSVDFDPGWRRELREHQCGASGHP